MSADRDEAIRRLFDEALEIEPGTRAAWLANACPDDDELRREVSALLAAYDARGTDVQRALEGLPRVASLDHATDVHRGDLRPGDRVSHYEVVGRLGHGGMGIVYQAIDTRLARTVALKLLPPELARDQRARRRFLQEARAASALRHPGICTVHEIGEAGDDRPFIVMAYVGGEPLRERLARRPLPLHEAIDVAVQVAEALAHAHRHGIVHRDVKPGNVMVEPDGRVTVVDFGVAKTTGVSLTGAGVVLGTLSCMSPEQVNGGIVDRRSDVWALGVLLYEMLAGCAPFRRERPEAEATAILSADPEPLTALRSGIPLALDGIVLKMLSKDPAARYQRAEDVAADLRAVDLRRADVRAPGARARRVGPSGSHVSSVLAAGTVLLALLALLVGGWYVTREAGGAPPAAVHFSLTLPDDQQLSSWFHPLALSPQGTELVYSARAEDAPRLYLRALERLTTTALAGGEGGRDPFFSADGAWIGFFADRQLKKIPVGGGIPQVVCDAPQGSGASWAPDDSIVFALGVGSGLLRVAAGGGPVETLTMPDSLAGEISHNYPQYLPDDRVLFSIWASEGWRTALLDPGSGEWRVLFTGGAAARYVPTGHLVYAEMATGEARPRLLARPFNLTSGSVGASPASVLDPPGLAGPNFAISGGGTLAYIASGSPAWAGLNEGRLVWLGGEGPAVPVLEDSRWVDTPRLSPDGRRIAYGHFAPSGTFDVWVYDLERGTTTRISRQGSINNFPVWSPDGETLTFNSSRMPFGLYRRSADGTGEPELLVERRRQYPQLPGSWSADGRTLAFTELDEGRRGNLWVYDRGTGASELLATEAHEHSPRFSPSAPILAYVTDASGTEEVHVRRYPELTADIVVSAGGGTAPAWSPDGSRLYYRRGDVILAAVITDGSRLSSSAPTAVFEAPLLRGTFGHPNYDVAADGRVVAVEPVTASPPTAVNVVLNWFPQLEALAAR